MVRYEYSVRVDTVDYSVDPRVIGRFVDGASTPTTVTAAISLEPPHLRKIRII